MIRSGGAAMGEDEPKTQSDDGDETPNVVVPLHSPLPPPPEITFTRPTGGRFQSQFPHSDQRSGSQTPDPGSNPGIVKVGVGLASGLTFGASVVGGILVGGWIDQHWKVVAPWGTIGMLLVGLAAGFINMFRLLNITGKGR